MTLFLVVLGLHFGCAACGLSLVAESEATLCCGAWASPCSGFLLWTQVLGAQASVVAARGLGSCGTRA